MTSAAEGKNPVVDTAEDRGKKTANAPLNFAQMAKAAMKRTKKKQDGESKSVRAKMAFQHPNNGGGDKNGRTGSSLGPKGRERENDTMPIMREGPSMGQLGGRRTGNVSGKLPTPTPRMLQGINSSSSSSGVRNPIMKGSSQDTKKAFRRGGKIDQNNPRNPRDDEQKKEKKNEEQEMDEEDEPLESSWVVDYCPCCFNDDDDIEQQQGQESNLISDNESEGMATTAMCPSFFTYFNTWCAYLCCAFSGCFASLQKRRRVHAESVSFFSWCFDFNMFLSGLFCCICLRKERMLLMFEKLGNDSNDNSGDVDKKVSSPQRSNLNKAGKLDDDRGDAILSVHIHEATLMPTLGLKQPMVFLHVINLKTGRYVKKTDSKRKIVSAYEVPTDTLPPVITRPFDLIPSGRFQAKWNQELKLNERVSHLCNQNALLMFEIADIDTQFLDNATKGGKRFRDGFCHVAWGFLKLVSPHRDVQYLGNGKDLQIQLYRYTATSQRYNRSARGVPHIYYEWLFQDTFGYEKYPSALHVRVNSCKPLNRKLAIGSRPQLPTDIEQGRMNVQELVRHSSATTAAFNNPSSLGGPASANRLRSIRSKRRRERHEKCRIPNFQAIEVQTDMGCQAVAFSPDGNYIAAACRHLVVDDHMIVTVKIYDVGGGFIHSFLGHHDSITGLSWNRDSSKILSSSADQTAKIFSMKRDLAGARETKHIVSLQHTSQVNAARFNPFSENSKVIVTGANDSYVRIWSSESRGSLLARLKAHNSSVTSIAFGIQGRFYTSDTAGVVCFWADKHIDHGKRSTSTSEWKERLTLTQSLQIDQTAIRCLRYRAEKLAVYTASDCIYLLALRNSRVKKQLRGATCQSAVLNLAFSPDGSYIIAGSDNGRAYIWSTLTCAVVSMLETGFRAALCDVTWHPSEHLVALCADGQDDPILAFDSKVQQRNSSSSRDNRGENHGNFRRARNSYHDAR
eukprot:jgi/Bigna1/87363/estExt_fgenesh1_pg.C_190170